MPGDRYYGKRTSRPVVQQVLRDGWGRVVDTTAAITKEVKLRPAGATAPVTTHGFSTVDVTLRDGSVVKGVQWQGGTEFDTATEYEQECRVEWVNGEPKFFPSDGYNRIVVTDDVA